MNFQNLSEFSNHQILDCFNDAFSDYSVPIKLSLNQLEVKLASESINKSLSYGAVIDGSLVGFVLHGDRMLNGKRVLYNAGTGVIPAHRGQKITRRMYEAMAPALLDKNVKKVVLEVIADNVPAIKSYESIGFKHKRDLNCYKADLAVENWNKSVEVKQGSVIELNGFGDVQASWQNANETIANLGERAIFLQAFYNDELCGYCMLNALNHRILQLAVKQQHRKKGIGSAILHHIQQFISNTVSAINVDSGHEETLLFLEKNGFELFLIQKEMELGTNCISI